MDGIQENTVYIKFKIENASELEFRRGEAIPWVSRNNEDLQGGAIQMASNKNLNEIDQTNYKIIQRSVYKNGKWVDEINDYADEILKNLTCD